MEKSKTTAARRRKKPDEQREVCDDCVFTEWDMKFHNLDVNRKPILLRCPYEDFAIIRGTIACDKYKPKTTNENE